MNNTTPITPDTTVSAVAAQYPAALRMLEALGIDYCCGGKLPLQSAAMKAGMPVETVIAVLQAGIAQATNSAAEQNWQHVPLDELMQHIVNTHHDYLKRELPRLEQILATVVRVHGPMHDDELRPLAKDFAALKAELTAHLLKEETVSFPAIARLLKGEGRDEAAKAIVDLEQEHEAAGELLHAMREITRNYTAPADACNTYRALYSGLSELEQDIHRHIHLENNVLFPRVPAL